jgi:hypothetical protein
MIKKELFEEAKKPFLKYNLQYFADGGDDGDGADKDTGDHGDDNQDDDQGDDDQDDSQDDKAKGKSKKSGKRYLTQEDVDRIVEERLKRERKKQERKKKAKEDKKDDKDSDKSDESAKKLSELEMKVLCYDHDIAKEYVKEAIALAKAYVDEDTDMDEALDIVTEKFPQFVKGYKADKDQDDDDDGEDKKKKGSWGKRQGKEAKKPKTLEEEIREQLFG